MHISNAIGLASALAVCAAGLAQTTPRARVLIVDSSGALWDASERAPGAAARRPRPRAIDRNESAAVDICLSYVDAQLEYLRTVRQPDGSLAFAEKIRSASGSRDGLYWEPAKGGEESPMGPKFAAAAAAELPRAEARPLFGYYFKILAAQGSDAPGGARDYHVDGRLVGGFAMVAWPAEYGVTGVRAFQVNQVGEVYAKDLGRDTQRIAMSMTAFAPDGTWTKVASAAD